MTVVCLESAAGTAKMELREPTEHLQGWWVKGAFYEPSMLDWIRRHYSGGTFIDAGASVGNHTVYFALFCDAKVLAIEPVPELMDHLVRNVDLNDLQDRVIREQCAVSDKESQGVMENMAPDGHLTVGMHQYRECPEGDIQAVTLDSLVDKHQITDVTLVKIDVEDHEMQVLRGAERLLETQRPVIFIEAVDREYLRKVWKYLYRRSYYYKSQWNPTPTFEFVYSLVEPVYSPKIRGPHRGRRGKR